MESPTTSDKLLIAMQPGPKSHFKSCSWETVLESGKRIWEKESEYEREWTLWCATYIFPSVLRHLDPQLPKMMPTSGSKKSTIQWHYIFEKEKQVMPCLKLWALIRGSLHSMTTPYDGTETQILASIQVNYQSLFDLILTFLWDWLKPSLEFHYSSTFSSILTPLNMSLLRKLTSNTFEWKSLLPINIDLSSLNLLGSILEDITVRRWENQDWTKKRVDLYSSFKWSFRHFYRKPWGWNYSSELFYMNLRKLVRVAIDHDLSLRRGHKLEWNSL